MARVEEWSEQFLELLGENDVPAGGTVPSRAHKSHLFFLRNMLREEEGAAAGVGAELQDALLAKLRSVAGLALGGNAISPIVGHARESLHYVQPHEAQAGGELVGSYGAPFPRALVPIAGTRNPFRE